MLDYLEGKPLQGPLPTDQALKLAVQIASALEEAHARGILHRDLKPANVMVMPRGEAKLLDFGLAKLVDADVDVTRTIDGVVVGTAAYMSPEQAEGKPLDARSDIFSFGAVLYEILSGSRAFAGHTAAQVLSGVLRDDPPPFRTPPALDQILRRCLRKQAHSRVTLLERLTLSLEMTIFRGPACHSRRSSSSGAPNPSTQHAASPSLPIALRICRG